MVPFDSLCAPSRGRAARGPAAEPAALPQHRINAVQDFAFLQVGPRKIFVGWGPFTQLAMRRPEQPAFFITDFFLGDPHPWRHPARWEELSFEEFAAQASPEPLQVRWQPPQIAEFAPLFQSAR